MFHCLDRGRDLPYEQPPSADRRKQMNSVSLYERLARLDSGLSLLRPERRLREMLRSHYYLFASLSDEEAQRLLEGCEAIFFKEGAVIFGQGECGDSLYLIASGEVEIVYEDAGGRRAVVGCLREGEGFGEMSILSGRPRSATARVPNRAMVFRVSLEIIDRQPLRIIHKLYANMTAGLIGKVERANEEISRLKGILKEDEGGPVLM